MNINIKVKPEKHVICPLQINLNSFKLYHLYDFMGGSKVCMLSGNTECSNVYYDERKNIVYAYNMNFKKRGFNKNHSKFESKLYGYNGKNKLYEIDRIINHTLELYIYKFNLDLLKLAGLSIKQKERHFILYKK